MADVFSRMPLLLAVSWISIAGSACTDQPISSAQLAPDGRLRVQLEPHAATVVASQRATTIEVEGVIASELSLAARPTPAVAANDVLYLHMRLSSASETVPARFVWTNLLSGRQEVSHGPVFASAAFVPVSQVSLRDAESNAPWRVEVYADADHEDGSIIFAQDNPGATASSS